MTTQERDALEFPAVSGVRWGLKRYMWAPTDLFEIMARRPSTQVGQYERVRLVQMTTGELMVERLNGQLFRIVLGGGAFPLHASLPGGACNWDGVRHRPMSEAELQAFRSPLPPVEAYDIPDGMYARRFMRVGWDAPEPDGKEPIWRAVTLQRVYVREGTADVVRDGGTVALRVPLAALHPEPREAAQEVSIDRHATH